MRGAVEPAAAGRHKALAFSLRARVWRILCFDRPSRPQPCAAERPSVMRPPTTAVGYIRFSNSSGSMSHLRFLPFLLLGVILYGCDTGRTADAEPDGLLIEPLQRSEALVSGIAQAGASARLGSTDSGFSSSVLADAPYGCLVSSPNLDNPEGGRYQYEAARLRFPNSVVKSAEGRRRFVQVVVGSATLYADAPRAAPVAARMARCLIPDSDRAEAMLDRAVRRFRPGRGRRWEGEPMPGLPEVNSNAAGSGASRAVSSSRSISGAPASAQASMSSGGQVCVAWNVTVLVYPDGSWVELSRRCVAWGDDIRGGVTVTADRDNGSGGSGSDGSGFGDDDGDDRLRREYGDDADPCAMATSAEEYLYCKFGSGSWSSVPYRPDEHSPATKSEVDNLIRQTCPGQQPADLGGYFQASVRRSLNQATVPRGGRSYNPEPGSGVSNPVDGWVNDLRNARTGEVIPEYVTSLLEVKFTMDPRNQLSGSQYRTHINALARAYSAPGARVSGAPLYVLVTNSQFNAIGFMGPGPTGDDLLSYAAGQRVNVMHLRITRDVDKFYLSGDLIGSPANFQSWVWDLARDVEHPFVVSCEPER